MQDINNTNFMQVLDNDLNCDPNHNYDKLINIIYHFKNKHLGLPVMAGKIYDYDENVESRTFRMRILRLELN